jgi:hypothetical protein
MKTFSLSTNPLRPQRGSTVIVLMILLGIMLALVTANIVSVRTLNRELIRLDKRQQQRLKP